jgi:serine/threonine-protein kinase
MRQEEGNGQDVRRQLERMLSSAAFARSERLSGFLRLVVERHLEGRDEEIKESLIAVEVFGRKPDYDPQRDSIVRTEAGRLRARLAEYYVSEGGGDPVIIELPKGGYVPVFRPAGGADNRLLSSARPRRRQNAMACATAALAVALAAASWWRFHQNAPIPVAVLPLTNLNQDPGTDYFADGLTGELIRNLSIIDGLAVRSQTSSFAFKGKPRNVHEVGKQLEADYILEGSVLRADQQLRINAQLVRVRDDFPLWSGRFDRELTDILVVQDEISRGIVNSLRLKLGHGQRHYETSPEAYDLYLRARALTIQYGLTVPDERISSKSISSFEQAIAKDPSFAPAYAGLAAAHAARSGQVEFDPADEMTKMRAAADKAIQLDPLLAEAHEALALAYSRDAQWEQSEKSFRRAIELDPNRADSYGHFAMFLLLPLGRIDEAIRQTRIAERADPLSPAGHGLAYMLISAGRYGEAAAYCEKLSADFERKSNCLARARLGQGKIGEAIQILETAFNRGASERSPVPLVISVRGELGYAYARAGRREEAEKIVSAKDPFNQALIFAGLGDKDRVLEALERGTTAGPFRIGRILTWPELALIRGDPRVKALRKKVGLPE